MTPDELRAEQFAGYPPQAKRIAEENLAVLRRLPLSFSPLLLRELITYDWRFPAEQRTINNQFAYLRSLSPEQLKQEMAAFDRLRIPMGFERENWASAPGEFSERLTSHLWTSHQIEAFRAAAVEYMRKLQAATPAETLPAPRLGIVLVGQGVKENRYPLFRRLRKRGMFYSRVQPEGGMLAVREAFEARMAAHPVPYGHWYIDGSPREAATYPGAACVSWSGLATVRTALLGRVRKAVEGGAGPEMLRTLLAKTEPHDLGWDTGDAPLGRFQVSLFTEGSGTQIYSTTFVQWAAREAMRRAEPLTMLVRFGPRLGETSLGELMSKADEERPLDPQGALVDGDMGAYYTWIGQQRLSGADNSRFLVWFEDHGEALAIAPSLERGKSSEEPVSLKEVLRRMG